jgi:hypothetical protein
MTTPLLDLIKGTHPDMLSARELTKAVTGDDDVKKAGPTKYVKRTGVKGNYKYEYANGGTHRDASERRYMSHEYHKQQIVRQGAAAGEHGHGVRVVPHANYEQNNKHVVEFTHRGQRTTSETPMSLKDAQDHAAVALTTANERASGDPVPAKGSRRGDVVGQDSGGRPLHRPHSSDKAHEHEESRKQFMREGDLEQHSGERNKLYNFARRHSVERQLKAGFGQHEAKATSHAMMESHHKEHAEDLKSRNMDGSPDHKYHTEAAEDHGEEKKRWYAKEKGPGGSMQVGEKPARPLQKRAALGYLGRLREKHGRDTTAENDAMTEAVKDGWISGAAIVGSGYKNPKKAALLWLADKKAKIGKKSMDDNSDLQKAIVAHSEAFGFGDDNSDLEKGLQDRINKFNKKQETGAEDKRKKLEGLPRVRAGGPYIGKRGGKWADAKHTIAWKEGKPPSKQREHAHGGSEKGWFNDHKDSSGDHHQDLQTRHRDLALAAREEGWKESRSDGDNRKEELDSKAKYHDSMSAAHGRAKVALTYGSRLKIERHDKLRIGDDLRDARQHKQNEKFSADGQREKKRGEATATTDESGNAVSQRLVEQGHVPIKGMDGPFQTKTGHVYHYDRSEKKYYDAKTDMHVDNALVEKQKLPASLMSTGKPGKQQSWIDRQDEGKKLPAEFSDVYGEAGWDRPRASEKKSKKKAKLSSIISDMNDKNAPPGGWSDEDRVPKEASKPGEKIGGGRGYTEKDLLAHAAKDGVTAGDLKYAFGGHSQAHAAALKKLVGQGKMERKGNKYFPKGFETKKAMGDNSETFGLTYHPTISAMYKTEAS